MHNCKYCGFAMKSEREKKLHERVHFKGQLPECKHPNTDYYLSVYPKEANNYQAGQYIEYILYCVDCNEKLKTLISAETHVNSHKLDRGQQT